MVNGFTWWAQFLLGRPLESKIICLHKSVLKCMLNEVKFSVLLIICVKFLIPKWLFLHLDLFSNHKDWFHKINIKMINSSQIKNKCQESIFHAQNDSLKILCYLLAIHIVPLSFSITNVPFESYFEIYRTLLQCVCCFSLGS